MIREDGGPHTLQVQELDTQEKRVYFRKDYLHLLGPVLGRGLKEIC